MVFGYRFTIYTRFKMLRERFQTLFILLLLAVGLLMVASEEASDEEPRVCPAGSQPQTSSTGDDDGEDDVEDQSACVDGLSLEPTEDEPAVQPASDEDGEDEPPAETSTLFIFTYLGAFIQLNKHLNCIDTRNGNPSANSGRSELG